MSFIEIAFLSPTQDQEVFNSHWPVIANKLTHPNPGITAASQGSILFYKNHQNKNARTEFTNLVIIEWESQSKFQDFLKSDQVKDFRQAMKVIANGPPMLELYNGDRHIPTDFCSKEVAQIVRVTVPSTEDYSNVRDIWRESGLAVLSGTSSNGKENLFAGVLFWDDPEVLFPPSSLPQPWEEN